MRPRPAFKVRKEDHAALHFGSLHVVPPSRVVPRDRFQPDNIPTLPHPVLSDHVADDDSGADHLRKQVIPAHRYARSSSPLQEELALLATCGLRQMMKRHACHGRHLGNCDSFRSRNTLSTSPPAEISMTMSAQSDHPCPLPRAKLDRGAPATDFDG